MGSESEVDKERNMDSHRRGEKDRQGRSERKGRRVALERGDKGAWKRSWQRCSVDRRVGLARHGNGARRLLANAVVLISHEFCCLLYQI